MCPPSESECARSARSELAPREHYTGNVATIRARGRAFQRAAPSDVALELRPRDSDQAALARRDFNRAVGRRHDPESRPARRAGPPRARCALSQMKSLRPRREAERAGVRMGDGAHQIEDPPRRPSPIDAAVRRDGGGRNSCRGARSCGMRGARPATISGWYSRISLGAERHQLAIQRQRGVAVVDRDARCATMSPASARATI